MRPRSPAPRLGDAAPAIADLTKALSDPDHVVRGLAATATATWDPPRAPPSQP